MSHTYLVCVIKVPFMVPAVTEPRIHLLFTMKDKDGYCPLEVGLDDTV